jgi:predicted tellurium resistance membrane protein TerC
MMVDIVFFLDSVITAVGLALVGESFGMHIPKGYIYFAMAFSISVEMLNMRLRKRHGRSHQL